MNVPHTNTAVHMIVCVCVCVCVCTCAYACACVCHQMLVMSTAVADIYTYIGHKHVHDRKNHVRSCTHPKQHREKTLSCLEQDSNSCFQSSSLVLYPLRQSRLLSTHQSDPALTRVLLLSAMCSTEPVCPCRELCRKYTQILYMQIIEIQ